VSSKVRHVGIVVKDLEASYQFYKKYFGFTEDKRAIEKGSFIDSLLGYENIQVTTLKMLDQSKEHCLELLAFDNPSLEKCKTNHFCRQGITHIALTVKNIDHLYEQLRDIVSFINEPSISTDGFAKVAFFKGMDDELIELVEELEQS